MPLDVVDSVVDHDAVDRRRRILPQPSSTRNATNSSNNKKVHSSSSSSSSTIGNNVVDETPTTTNRRPDKKTDLVPDDKTIMASTTADHGRMILSMTTTTKLLSQPQNNYKKQRQRQKRATDRDVAYALTVYLLLPLAFLYATITSISIVEERRHHHQLVLEEEATCILLFLQAHKNLLLLGFSTPQCLWSALQERLLSTFCWAITFLFIRKGINPKTRKGFLHRYWRGTVLSFLSVFYSSFSRMVLQRLGIIHCQTRICHAALVGLSWATMNALIRRRLDPALRDNMWHRSWKDFICGGSALSITSYWRHTRYAISLRKGMEGILHKRLCLFQYPIVAIPFQFLFGIDSDQEFCHVVAKAFQTGYSWGMPYLLVRRGCNPNTRPVFLTKYGHDAFFGSVALFYYTFLKLATHKWLPVLFQYPHANRTATVYNNSHESSYGPDYGEL